MIVSRHSSMCSATSLTLSKKSTLLQIAYIKDRKYLYMTVFAGNLLALCVGFSFSWSSPVLLKLTDEKYLDSNPLRRLITSEEASWIGSLLSLGGMFGVFLAVFTASKFGRKKALWLSCVIPFVAGFSITGYAKEVHLYFLARFIIGVGVSGVYTVVPMYLGEISEDDIRGFVCALMMTFETAGELITYCSMPYITIYASAVVSVVITVAVAIVIISWLPESPYFLLSMKDKNGAEKSLMKLRNETKEGVSTELDYIESVLQDFVDNEVRFIDLFRTKAARKSEIITLGLTVFQHLSGILPVMLYSQNIFKETGSSIPPEICTMIIAVIQFFASFIAPNLVDKLGRRWMLFLSALGMLISQCLLGLYFFFKERQYDLSEFYWLPIACYICFLISYLIGFGPLIWTIMGEIFMPNLKAKAFLIGLEWLDVSSCLVDVVACQYCLFSPVLLRLKEEA
ncbi:hypothetical protein ILUMI_18519 [Ignelater luminosus]|uniref:Major facilitator superfamily (MFS) profile domain-containing protein n=1 Tax=Ignelater luminosus TaxID=2038154 RepID=A0A8K0G6B6_IGNLU|nr:hypothetical protein ILUMI_18519 [Ignelater luminosus]